MAIAALVALSLTACGLTDGDDPANGESFDPIATEIRSWEPCEVLEDLRPFVDFMGIEEWVATKVGPEHPDSVGWSEANLDPDALNCAGGIDLGALDSMPRVGGLSVKIVPWEDDEKAATMYDDRMRFVEERKGDVEDVRTELSDPWDAGVLIASSAESGATEYLGVLARDGRWLIEIDLSFTGEYFAQQGGDPDYPFTNGELHQWLLETYLPSVNSAVNDRLAEFE